MHLPRGSCYGGRPGVEHGPCRLLAHTARARHELDRCKKLKNALKKALLTTVVVRRCGFTQRVGCPARTGRRARGLRLVRRPRPAEIFVGGSDAMRSCRTWSGPGAASRFLSPDLTRVGNRAPSPPWPASVADLQVTFAPATAAGLQCPLTTNLSNGNLPACTCCASDPVTQPRSLVVTVASSRRRLSGQRTRAGTGRAFLQPLGSRRRLHLDTDRRRWSTPTVGPTGPALSGAWVAAGVLENAPASAPSCLVRNRPVGRKCQSSGTQCVPAPPCGFKGYFVLPSSSRCRSIAPGPL
jgi:hypothetical protein